MKIPSEYITTYNKTEFVTFFFFFLAGKSYRGIHNLDFVIYAFLQIVEIQNFINS